MLTCKIALPDKPHPIILLTKIPDFGHFISLDGMNSVFLAFNKYLFSFFCIWLLPEKFSVCLKNDDFASLPGSKADAGRINGDPVVAADGSMDLIRGQQSTTCWSQEMSNQSRFRRERRNTPRGTCDSDRLSIEWPYASDYRPYYVETLFLMILSSPTPATLWV